MPSKNLSLNYFETEAGSSSTNRITFFLLPYYYILKFSYNISDCRLQISDFLLLVIIFLSIYLMFSGSTLMRQP